MSLFFNHCCIFLKWFYFQNRLIAHTAKVDVIEGDGFVLSLSFFDNPIDFMSSTSGRQGRGHSVLILGPKGFLRLGLCFISLISFCKQDASQYFLL